MSTNNKSVFPTPELLKIDGSNADDARGITLRDYFAAKAMQGMLADLPNGIEWKEGVADAAYQFADAMLEVRENTMQTPVAWWSGEPDTYILCNAEYQRHKDNENFDAIRHLKPLYAMRESGE